MFARTLADAGPGLKRASLGRKQQGLPMTEMLIGGLEILEQDRPGDDINGEMVDSQQETGGLLGPKSK